MGRGKILLWLLAMLLVPPAAGFAVLAMSQSFTAGIIFYAVLMIGLGIGAALAWATGSLFRTIIAICLPVGMLVVQCAVFFVGCSIIVSGFH